MNDDDFNNDITCAASTRRGRERAGRILDAATEVFLERGFEASTMSEIGRRAGGSMQTLYRLFGSKECLFRAIMERKARSVFGPLEDERIYDQPPALALFELGMRLNRLVLDRQTLLTHRVMVAECHRNPGLRRIFYETGPGRVRCALAMYFEVETRRGRLSLTDPAMAAGQFLELVKGAYFLPAMLGEEISPSDDDVEQSVRQAVEIFLNGASAGRPAVGHS